MLPLYIDPQYWTVQDLARIQMDVTAVGFTGHPAVDLAQCIKYDSCIYLSTLPRYRGTRTRTEPIRFPHEKEGFYILNLLITTVPLAIKDSPAIIA